MVNGDPSTKIMGGRSLETIEEGNRMKSGGRKDKENGGVTE